MKLAKAPEDPDLARNAQKKTPPRGRVFGVPEIWTALRCSATSLEMAQEEEQIVDVDAAVRHAQTAAVIEIGLDRTSLELVEEEEEVVDVNATIGRAGAGAVVKVGRAAGGDIDHDRGAGQRAAIIGDDDVERASLGVGHGRNVERRGISAGVGDGVGQVDQIAAPLVGHRGGASCDDVE